MLTDTVSRQIKEAMKAKDEIGLSTLKMLSAALTNAEIAKKRVKLTKEEEWGVVRAEAKKRKDAIEIYEKAGEEERAEREKAELAILQKYLPKELSDQELSDIATEVIVEVGAKSLAQMGRVMGMMMAKVQGKASGDRVSEVVKQKLSSSKDS